MYKQHTSSRKELVPLGNAGPHLPIPRLLFFLQPDLFLITEDSYYFFSRICPLSPLSDSRQQKTRLAAFYKT